MTRSLARSAGAALVLWPVVAPFPVLAVDGLSGAKWQKFRD